MTMIAASPISTEQYQDYNHSIQEAGCPLRLVHGHGQGHDCSDLSPNKAMERAIEIAKGIAAVTNNLERYYALGQAVLRAREGEMPAKQVMDSIAEKSELAIRSIQAAARFASQFSVEDLGKLKAGKFPLSWHMVANHLSKAPREFIAAYLGADDLKGMCNALRPAHQLDRCDADGNGKERKLTMAFVESLQMELSEAKNRIAKMNEDKLGYEYFLRNLRKVIAKDVKDKVARQTLFDIIDSGEGWALPN